MTMPKQRNTTDVNVRAVRRAIASAYALGGTMIVPWDIFLFTSNASRYYGTPELYGDLYAFVRAHALLFERADERLGYAPSTSDAVLRGTGAGGDGVRWRLPSDQPPAHGRIVGSGTNLGSCAWLSRGAVGFFHSPATCIALDELHEVHGTQVEGLSYARRAAPIDGAAPTPFRSTSAGIDVLARRVLPRRIRPR